MPLLRSPRPGGGGRLAALLCRRTTTALALLAAGGEASSPARSFASAAGLPPPPPPQQQQQQQAPLAPLRFVAESHYIPSPDKTNGGEDALFASRYALGVADGVGGWSEHGVDSGVYARALLAAARGFCEEALARGEQPDAVAALEHAHASVRVGGSSTACLALAGRRGALEVANVGDSGMQVWRRSRPRSLTPVAPLRLEEAGLLWEHVWEAPQQQHYFNCPLQLSADATSDRPRGGAHALVAVEPGDLLVLATDGLWDNLSQADVRGLLARVDFAACTQLARMSRVRFAEALRAEQALGTGGSGGAGQPQPPERLKLLGLAPEVAAPNATFAAKEKECRGQLSALAHLLTAAAIRVGGDTTSTTTPFALGARKAKMRWQGGKLDDTAVVVALAVADEEHFDTFEGDAR
jgi:hypothetical protein